MTQSLIIPHLAMEAASEWPDAIAVIDENRRVTFHELAELMLTAASAFVSAGIEPGERVALWAPNSLDWIVACLGLQAAGCVLVPLNTRFRGQEAQFILNRSKAVMLVLVEEFLGVRYADLLEGLELPHVRRTVRFSEGHGPSSWSTFLESAGATHRAAAERRLRELTPGTVSDIMFTSGTTGEPKGAMCTHEQTVRTARLWAKATSLGERDRFLILWPFFHSAGYKAGWVVCLAHGATSLPEPQLDVERLIAKVERERVTFLPGPPTLFRTLLTSPLVKPASLASVRVSVTGASSVAPSLIKAMREELKIPTVLAGYGLTEACGTLTMTSADDPPEVVVTSCGRAIEGIEIVIAGPDGSRLPVGEQGEVLARGMNIMLGYLDDPVATAEAIDREGWLHTGDIGVLDEAGYLRITDRKKDMFIVGGFNCYPAEIERLMHAHPAILQIAVIGVPDDRLGEVAKAYIVLKPGAELDAETLIAWARSRMANYKVPRSVAFVDSLPTNLTGKVQKFKLASQ
jgi:acyl-CoA synthetase (AMP-forming)/AMP-acid ligase II